MSSTRGGRKRDGAAAPARVAAFRTLRRVFESGAYADRAIRGAVEGLDARDRALATRLVFGTVQRCDTLDALLATCTDRPLDTLDPPVLAALRLGAYGLLFLDRAPAYATVSDSVTLAGRGGGLVNAVLRRVGREGPDWVAALPDATPVQAAVRHSVPAWLARLWFAELGAEDARSLLAAINEPAEAAVRINPLRGDPTAVRASLPVAADPAPGLPEALVLREPFDVHGSAQFGSGQLMPQSRASMHVARSLAPVPGERILDLCAAPGGKTTHLAALAADRAEIVAVERHPGRARALTATCARMGATSVDVRTADAVTFSGPERFDAVLVDPPCSGLGTLRSRPDLRWHMLPKLIEELVALQAQILDTAAAMLVPRGRLVYSVCTLTRAEGEDQVEAFLTRHPDFVAAAPALTLRPDLDGTDGFFIARLHRGLPVARGNLKR